MFIHTHTHLENGWVHLTTQSSCSVIGWQPCTFSLSQLMMSVVEVEVDERGITPGSHHVTPIHQTTSLVKVVGRVGWGLACLRPIPHTLRLVLLIQFPIPSVVLSWLQGHSQWWRGLLQTISIPKETDKRVLTGCVKTTLLKIRHVNLTVFEWWWWWCESVTYLQFPKW